MNHTTHSGPKMPKLETIREAYHAELRDTIEMYVSEMDTLRRIKETIQDQEIKDAITGIIMDEITLINRYRGELL